MKLAILSCAPKAYSTRRLHEAALQRGHEADVLNTLKFAIDLDRGSPTSIIAGCILITTMQCCPANRCIHHLFRHGRRSPV